MKAILGDCFDAMASLPDASIDMVLCDLPYGTTACVWDAALPYDRLWAEYWRVCKLNGAVVLTSSQPFTTALISSQIEQFRYCWTWRKNRPTGFANAKKQPLREVEEINIFYRSQPVYNPQGLRRVDKVRKNSTQGGQTVQGETLGNAKGKLRTVGAEYVQEFTGYPTSVLEIASERGLHPTQKPVALFEYLIRTYTHEGMTVLDNTAGSGTTGVAAHRSGRDAVLIERDPEYFDKMVARLIAEGVDLDVEIA